MQYQHGLQNYLRHQEVQELTEVHFDEQTFLQKRTQIIDERNGYIPFNVLYDTYHNKGRAKLKILLEIMFVEYLSEADMNYIYKCLMRGKTTIDNIYTAYRTKPYRRLMRVFL